MTDLYIYGAGGFSKVLFGLVHAINEIEQRYNVLGFVDSDAPLEESLGLPVYRSLENLDKQAMLVIAVGDPKLRLKMLEEARDYGFCLATLVHPSSVIGYKVTIGPGSVILANAVLEPFVSIGRAVILNKSAAIGHDTVIGDCSVVHSNTSIAGECAVGKAVLVGQNSSIRQRTQVGDFSVVGAGSSVVKNIATGSTVLGVAASVKVQRS